MAATERPAGLRPPCCVHHTRGLLEHASEAGDVNLGCCSHLWPPAAAVVTAEASLRHNVLRGQMKPQCVWLLGYRFDTHDPASHCSLRSPVGLHPSQQTAHLLPASLSAVNICLPLSASGCRVRLSATMYRRFACHIMPIVARRCPFDSRRAPPMCSGPRQGWSHQRPPERSQPMIIPLTPCVLLPASAGRCIPLRPVQPAPHSLQWRLGLVVL